MGKKIFVVFLMALILFIGLIYYFNIYEKIEKSDQTYMMFVYKDDIETETIEIEEYLALKEESMLKIDHLKNLNVFVDYNEKEDIVSLSDGYTLIKYYFDRSELKINGELSQTSNQVFERRLNNIYVNFDFVKSYYNIQKIIGDDRKNIILRIKSTDYNVASVLDSSIVYSQDSIDGVDKSDLVAIYKSSESEEFIIGKTNDNYTEVITPNLIYGLVKSENVINLKTNENSDKISQEKTDKKINITWEYAENGNPNTSNIPQMKGLNVISPIWYVLKDNEGNLRSTYGPDYYTWAKSRGYQVWPVVKNEFSNMDKTSSFIRSQVSREKLINKLVEDSINNGYDGINVDFENMYLEDRYYFSVFISELATMLRKNDILISVDVTVMGGSDTWSKSVNREELGRVIDYLVVMTYDEHWAASPISGSVSSYNWIDKSIKNIIDIVPSEKVIIGLPFYMRVWSETPSTTVANSMDVRSSVLTMKYVKSYIEKYDLDLIWDENAKQYYSVYIIDGSLKKIWFEENRSIASKIDIVHKYNLAGVASWRRGFEDQSIWNTIDNELNK